GPHRRSGKPGRQSCVRRDAGAPRHRAHHRARCVPGKSRRPAGALSRATGRVTVAMTEAELRRQVVETAQAMQARGLSPQRSGNVSARVADGMVITPSGLPFETLDAGDVGRLALDGSVVDGAREPSSEWRLHAAVYRARPEVAAVVHCHSPNATAVACTRRPIPAFH